MAKRRYTDGELQDMGVEILRSLKNKGLRIKDVRTILNHATIAIEYILFGDSDEEDK